ncbi:MAG: cupredoxin domain-containing protein [Nanoarchaeota archaeon]
MKLKLPIFLLLSLFLLLIIIYSFSLHSKDAVQEDPVVVPVVDEYVVMEEDMSVEEVIKDDSRLVVEESVVLADSIPSGQVVHIVKNMFTPKTLTITKGTTVVWINDDQNVHQIKERSVNHLFRSDRLNPGESTSFTFTQPGDYHYIDTINTYMSGLIIVTEGLSGITGNVIGFSKQPSNLVTLIIFILIGLTIIYRIDK